MESLLEAVAENLKLRARKTGLDQQELAALAGLNRNTVSAALAGKDLRLSTLIRLSRAVGFTDWLLPLLERPQPSPLQLLDESQQKGRRSRRQKERPEAERPAHRKQGRQKEGSK